VLCWTLVDANINSNMFVAYFSLNVYVGNWLKNLFALERPEGFANLRDTSDFGWPSMYALNAVGLPFFVLRYLFGAFGQGTIYSFENQMLTAASYSAGIVWVCIVCGARLYSGVSSPADVQGGMLVGGVLVRIWLPVCEDVHVLLSQTPVLLGMPQATFLLLLALALMLVHPFTPGDPRSWTALAFSTKAVAFGTSFIIGSNTCAVHEWCSSGQMGIHSLPHSSILASAGLLVFRCAIGFGLMFAATRVAAALSSVAEARLRVGLPTKPCAPPIVRNAAVFTANGIMVSLGVPTFLAALGI